MNESQAKEIERIEWNCAKMIVQKTLDSETALHERKLQEYQKRVLQ